MKTGIANLPLHYGSTPRWLFEKMTVLAREISLVIILEYGIGEYLKKLANPNWFQAFGCVLGFDWHSSGLTTTTCGAIKEGLRPLQKDLGLFVCGGKGKASRKTPQELEDLGQKFSFDAKPLVYASRISAKVDNNALQDGYQLYHHTFFVTKDGQWAVIQQGMKPPTGSGQVGWARRYHWLSENGSDVVNEPHSGIASEILNLKFKILNLTASESKNNRNISTKLSWQKPERTIKILKKLQESRLPARHHLLLSDINPQKLEKIFLKTYEKQPKSFEALLGMSGVGAKTLRALSLISELVYGAPVSTRDPARFSFAHGGKDGIPYPVNRQTYDQSIEFLRQAVNKAKIGYWEKLHILRKLC